MKYLLICFLFLSCNVLKTITDGDTDPDTNFFSDNNNDHCDTSDVSTDCFCDETDTSSGCYVDNTVYSLNDNLISFWKFEETGSSDDRSDINAVNDFINFGGGVLTTSGQIGYGIDCSNFGAIYVNASSSSSLDLSGTEDFTIAMWVKVNSNVLGYFFEKESDIQIHNIDSGSGQHTDVNIWLFGGGFTLNTTNQPLSYSNWHHVVVKVDRDSGVYIIVDGDIGNATFGSYNSTSESFTANSAVHPCYFESAGPASIFNGELDSMGFWNKLLTDDEISALYHGNNDLD